MIEQFRGDYFFCSSFFEPIRVEYENMVFQSAEHAFQASKTLEEAIRRHVQLASTAYVAKRLGRRIRLRPHWEEIKIEEMTKVQRAKFTQNEALKQKLLATGDNELIEGNYHRDSFWGVDMNVDFCFERLPNGNYKGGENWLGKILMKVRGELRWTPFK